MQVRPIDAGDHDEWLRLRRALWPQTAVEILKAEMTDILADRENQVVFVASCPAGSLGGFAEVSIHPHAIGCDTRPVGYLEGWYVDPDLRHTGIGRALVAAAENWARAQGCHEMASDSLMDNQTGISAHQACGYHETARLIHFKKRL